MRDLARDGAGRGVGAVEGVEHHEEAVVAGPPPAGAHELHGEQHRDGAHQQPRRQPRPPLIPHLPRQPRPKPPPPATPPPTMPGKVCTGEAVPRG